MDGYTFLLLNLAVCFYDVGTIWAHEVRSWRLVSAADFHAIQAAHWRKLPYWIFVPVGLALAGSIALLWFHPAASPLWAVWGNLICQVLSWLLTVLFWGQWQGRLSRDALGPRSPYLGKILRTHWGRTALITAAAAFVLAWAVAAAPD